MSFASMQGLGHQSSALCRYVCYSRCRMAVCTQALCMTCSCACRTANEHSGVCASELTSMQVSRACKNPAARSGQYIMQTGGPDADAAAACMGPLLQCKHAANGSNSAPADSRHPPAASAAGRRTAPLLAAAAIASPAAKALFSSGRRGGAGGHRRGGSRDCCGLQKDDGGWHRR